MPPIDAENGSETMNVMFNRSLNTIYLDMDGVLADFDKFVLEKMGRTFPHQTGPVGDREMWDFLMKVPNLYYQLEPTPYAMELWEFANHLCPRVELLTAIPRRTTMQEAEEDKRRWVKKYLGEDVVVNFGPYSRDKWKHATPGDILVDDRTDNIQDWINKGFGLGIHHVIDEYYQTAQRLSFLVNEDRLR